MSQLDQAVKEAVRQNWAAFADDITDPAQRKRFAKALADLAELTANAALMPERAADLAPEIAAVRSTLASLAALGAQKARRAARKTAADVGSILLKALTVAIAGV